MNQNDGSGAKVAMMMEATAAFIVKLDCHHASLDNEHLLQIVDLAFEGAVIVGGFKKTGFMG